MIRRIVCAAVKDSNGSIFLGVRHYDKLMKAPKIGIQGFVDNRGEFHTREEAYVIAFDAGQIIRRCGGDDGRLFSENLY